MNIVRTLFRKDPSLKIESHSSNGGFIEEVFKNCLFALPTAENHGPFCPPKCKTQPSREAGNQFLNFSDEQAFRLLEEAARDCPQNFMELIDLLSAQVISRFHHWLWKTNSLDVANEWNYFPAEREKALCGYVGLQNLVVATLIVLNFCRERLATWILCCSSCTLFPIFAEVS